MKAYYRFVFWVTIAVILMNAVLLALMTVAGLFWLGIIPVLTISFLSTVAGDAHERWIAP